MDVQSEIDFHLVEVGYAKLPLPPPLGPAPPGLALRSDSRLRTRHLEVGRSSRPVLPLPASQLPAGAGLHPDHRRLHQQRLRDGSH